MLRKGLLLKIIFTQHSPWRPFLGHPQRLQCRGDRRETGVTPRSLMEYPQDGPRKMGESAPRPDRLGRAKSDPHPRTTRDRTSRLWGFR